MTADQKKKVQQMRQKGLSYLQIASALCISENTIKSYCRRNNLFTSKEGSSAKTIAKKAADETNTTCKHCGNPLDQGMRGHPKKFCSGECRRSWWKANDGQLVKKAWYTLTCSGCGKEFESYGNQNRKFCDHACYIRKRFEKAGDDYDARAV